MQDVKIDLMAKQHGFVAIDDLPKATKEKSRELSLIDFVNDFGEGLLDRVAEQAPPLFDGSYPEKWDKAMDKLKRQPFDAQRDIVASIASLFFTHGQPAGVINAKMGTGKTMMAISLAAVAAGENMNKNLIVSPPHLVYKWRREILNTIPDAKVVTLTVPIVWLSD
ncbi:Superfamily II DNA/RNA helicases, SNF2 family [uncultured Gammaproteobacteria bacterium]|nr:Superfamily II DNA/RNA helicases, SNF2 family [uncultured Gammaproteobacteria bacterium]